MTDIDRDLWDLNILSLEVKPKHERRGDNAYTVLVTAKQSVEGSDNCLNYTEYRCEGKGLMKCLNTLIERARIVKNAINIDFKGTEMAGTYGPSKAEIKKPLSIRELAEKHGFEPRTKEEKRRAFELAAHEAREKEQ